MTRLAQLALVLVTVTATACAQGMGGDDPGIGDPGTGDPGSSSGGGPGSGGGGGGDLPGCEQTVSINLEVKALAPDVMLVVDRSSSMAEPLTPNGFDQKWDLVTGAIGTVVDQYTSSIDFGLMLFSKVGESCGAGEVNVGPKAGSGSTIKEVLGIFGNGPGGGTPTSGSLRNALSFFQNHPVNPYGRYVVLATDGQPMCEQDPVTNSLAALRDLRAAGVDTYVLGIALEASDVDVLNQMAQAGGTSSYYPVDSASDLAEVLGGITSTVTQVACDYTLRADSAAAALTVDLDGQPVSRSEDHSDGWDYDRDSHTLTFYGPACDQLKALGTGDISVSWCATPPD